MQRTAKTAEPSASQLEEVRRDLAVRMAVDRLYARVMALQGSDDMLSIVACALDEMIANGVPAIACSIAYTDAENQPLNAYHATAIYELKPDADQGVSAPETIGGHVVWERDPLWDGADEASGEILLQDLGREQVVAVQERFDLDLKDWAADALEREVAWVLVSVPFSNGSFAFAVEGSTERGVAVAKEFAKPLAVGYLRLLDMRQRASQAEREARGRVVRKVRGEALVMRASADIGSFITVLVDGWRGIGIAVGAFSLNIVDLDRNRLIVHAIVPRGAMAEGEWAKGEIVLADISPGMDLMRTWVPLGWAQDKGWVALGRKADLCKMRRSHLDDYREAFGWAPSEITALVGRIGFTIPFEYGSVWAMPVAGVDFAEEELRAAEEYAETLALVHTRFLDMEASERRQLEAAIAMAVERVRAETMAMRNSGHLLNVVGEVFQEIVGLGIDTRVCFVNLVDEELGQVRAFTAGTNPKRAGVSWTSKEIVELNENVAAVQMILKYDQLDEGWMENWSKGEVWTTTTTAERRNQWKRRFEEKYGLDKPMPASEYDMVVVDVPFTHGTIGVEVPYLTDDNIEIVRAFTDSLSLGFLRFLDLQKIDEAQRKLIEDLEEELQTAHELQLDLMPTQSPQIAGLGIAGRCMPANRVGGDFFQYFDREDRLAISMADVTGHAMEAAVPVMMFSGVLETEMRHWEPIESLFSTLNNVLCTKLQRSKFVCFLMGELDLASHRFRFVDCGCPYPYHYRAADGEVVELAMENYPLGVLPDYEYGAMEIQLAVGDRIVFCSDGIVEAGRADGKVFGYDRTAEAIRKGAGADLSAEELLDHLIGEVHEFAGDTPAEDDQTVVVLAVES